LCTATHRHPSTASTAEFHADQSRSSIVSPAKVHANLSRPSTAAVAIASDKDIEAKSFVFASLVYRSDSGLVPQDKGSVFNPCEMEGIEGVKSGKHSWVGLIEHVWRSERD
jgi:hypothetical protein